MRWFWPDRMDWLTDELLGRMASHHHTCWMCGNPRKHFKQQTDKEKLEDQKWQDWLEGERW
jgi:hypothetical protein